MTEQEAEKISKEAIKAERRRIREAILQFSNRDEIMKAIFTGAEQAKPKWEPIKDLHP